MTGARPGFPLKPVGAPLLARKELGSHTHSLACIGALSSHSLSFRGGCLGRPHPRVGAWEGAWDRHVAGVQLSGSIQLMCPSLLGSSCPSPLACSGSNDVPLTINTVSSALCVPPLDPRPQGKPRVAKTCYRHNTEPLNLGWRQCGVGGSVAESTRTVGTQRWSLTQAEGSQGGLPGEGGPLRTKRHWLAP